MEKYGKKHENPPGNFYSVLPIMHAIDCYSARSEYHSTIKNIYPRLGSEILGGQDYSGSDISTSPFLVGKFGCSADYLGVWNCRYDYLGV